MPIGQIAQSRLRAPGVHGQRIPQATGHDPAGGPPRQAEETERKHIAAHLTQNLQKLTCKFLDGFAVFDQTEGCLCGQVGYLSDPVGTTEEVGSRFASLGWFFRMHATACGWSSLYGKDYYDVRSSNCNACFVSPHGHSRGLIRAGTEDWERQSGGVAAARLGACVALLALVLASATADAATYTWSNGASTAVDSIPNWSGLAANFAAGDTAYWDGVQAGTLNLSLTGNAVMNPASPGINYVIDSGQTSPLTINSTNATATTRMDSITINPARGAFTFGSASLSTTVNTTLGGAGTLFGDTAVICTNNSSNTATIGANVFFNNSSAATHGFYLSGTAHGISTRPFSLTTAPASGWPTAVRAS